MYECTTSMTVPDNLSHLYKIIIINTYLFVIVWFSVISTAYFVLLQLFTIGELLANIELRALYGTSSYAAPSTDSRGVYASSIRGSGAEFEEWEWCDRDVRAARGAAA